jgi:hypothetical protein
MWFSYKKWNNEKIAILHYIKIEEYLKNKEKNAWSTAFFLGFDWSSCFKLGRRYMFYRRYWYMTYIEKNMLGIQNKAARSDENAIDTASTEVPSRSLPR